MAEPAPQTVPFPALSRWDRALILAIAVALFAALNGAIWRHLFDWDRTIGWSYAAVPPLVLLALLVRRRFSWLAWLLHSLELLFLKFAITAGALLLILVHAGPQGPPPSPPLVASPPPPAAAALPAPPAARGKLAGRVLQNGHAAPTDTLVFVSAGIADAAWPAPTTTLQLANDGYGFEPLLSAAQVGETITAISKDHRLHTLVMTQAGNAWRLNVPLLASGAATPVRAGDVEGVVDLACAVHRAAEHASRLVLLRHPFFQFLQADGSFAFEGVPPGTLTVTALSPDGARAETSIDVRPGETARAEWSLPAKGER
jgi:plastocyanin